MEVQYYVAGATLILRPRLVKHRSPVSKSSFKLSLFKFKL